ncbi:MAG: DUF2892 domain-containing protein [Parvularculaceae bacterium]
MKANMGMVDRVIRVLVAAGALYLFFTGARPVWEWVLLVVAVVFLLTSFVGVCPLYSLIGFKTRK